jgi:hypothetical protein
MSLTAARDFAVANDCHSEECSDEESALRYVLEKQMLRSRSA